MTRVGVLGGTFDPIHVGHVGIAEAVREALGLDQVDLVPSSQPPHKPRHVPAAPWHRFAMVVLATEDHPRLLASDREIARNGASYMIETLRGYGDDARPVLILGLDAFAELPSWHQPEALVAEFDVAVASRAGVDPRPVLRALPEWVSRRIAPTGGPAGRAAQRAPEGRIVLIDVPAFPVSASQVRMRCARGEDIKELVGSAVAAYIRKYRIYEG